MSLFFVRYFFVKIKRKDIIKYTPKHQQLKFLNDEGGVRASHCIIKPRTAPALEIMRSTGEQDKDIENPIQTDSTSTESGVRDNNTEKADERFTEDWRFGKHKDGTLKQKIAYIQRCIDSGEEIEGDEPNDKGKRPMDIKGKYNKILRKMKEKESDHHLKNEIIAFKYATDMSYLRRSSPDEVWQAILRREAWAQDPVKMSIVSVAQLLLCVIAMVTVNSDINPATLIMACIYIITVGASNSFEVTQDLARYFRQAVAYLASGKGKNIPLLVLFCIGCVLFLPVIAFLFMVTFVLDLMVGEIMDLSYGEYFNILIDFIVIFTGFSVGLRSGNAINAIQTFAGFHFIAEMDEVVLQSFTVDLNAKTSHIHSKGKSDKIMRVRVATYISCPILLCFFMYITTTNTCLLFCNADEQ